MEYIIDEKYEGARLDRVLRKILPDIALTEIFKFLRTGKIKLNGKKAKENTRVCIGDVIKVFGLTSEQVSDNIQVEENIILTEAEVKEIKNSIVYEDDKVLIINKKANLVMHKGSGHNYGLTEMIKSYLNNSDFTFVNRIDKATSGLVIGAKTIPVARELSEEIREGRIDKRYYIVVEGVLTKKEFTVTSYLKKTETEVIELDHYEAGAKESISRFNVISHTNNSTLLIGSLGSGRTHQLRVQLSSLGHPIVGDYKYGAKIKASRMMLHSYYLEIPLYNLKFELECPF